MQGERASLGSLSEALNFEHSSASNNAIIDQQIRWDSIHNLVGNDVHDYMSSGADTNATFANSVYREPRDLQRLNIAEASSSGTQNEATSHTEKWMDIGRLEERINGKLELSPMFVQPSSGNRVVHNVNLNAEYNEHLEGMNPVTGHSGLFDVNVLGGGLLPENGGIVGSSVDGYRASCKRKALDASIGQSSSSGGFREFQHGESSSWSSAPVYYNPAIAANDLNISLDHGPRGLVSGAVPIRSSPAITESSSRNYSVWVNPANQQETVNPSVFAAGTVIRRPVVPSFNSPGLLPADQQLIDLRYGHALGNFASQNPNAPATHMPPVSRNTFQWSESPVAAGVTSSSAISIDGNVIHRDETRQRSNILDIPFFVPAVPQLRNLPHGHISRNASGAGHVASSSSRTSIQPSPSGPAWTPYQNNSPPHNQRRLSEHFRRSLLSSLATTQRAARALVPPASPDEHVLQSGGVNTSHVQNRTYSRAGPRQGQNATDIAHPLRGLVSTSRGRSRMAASEIRSVLDHMRRGGNLRFEDIMLLNQSIALGGSDIQDRYRDMRLDVDNMTYEELLSLEERIGDVCTGLNEETISNRLKKQKHKSNSKSPQEVEPCCICQEEYNEGEEMGKLECGHYFHSQCIKDWLKQKNLCPICKTTGLNTTEMPRRE